MALNKGLGPALAVAGVGASLFLLVGAIATDPTGRALGSWNSETPWHIWRHAVWLRTLATEGPWLRSPEPDMLNSSAANLSPATTMLAWPVFVMGGSGVAGVVASWNFMYAAALVGVALGTGLSVRHWLSDEKGGVAAAGAAVTVACGAFLHEAPVVGRMENVLQFFWPLHLAFLLRARESVASGVGAALLLAFLMVQGGYPALFVGMVELPVLAWFMAGPTPRRSAATAIVTLATGVAATLPWIHANRLHPPIAMAEGREGAISVPLAQLLPGGADVPFARGYHEPPYPGILLVVAALVAAITTRASRFWFLMAAGTMVLVIGPELRWTVDGPLIATMPVGWLEQIPGWPVPSTGWLRLGTFLPVFLALAVAPAVVNRPRLACAVAVLASIDTLVYTRAWDEDVPYWNALPPPGLADDDGPTVWLPTDERALLWVHAGPAYARRIPVSLSAELPTLRWTASALDAGPSQFRRRGAGSASDPPSVGCVARDASVLAEAGFRRLALVYDRGDARPVEALLSEALGAPASRADNGAAWDLAVTTGWSCETAVGAVERARPKREGRRGRR